MSKEFDHVKAALSDLQAAANREAAYIAAEFGSMLDALQNGNGAGAKQAADYVREGLVRLGAAAEAAVPALAIKEAPPATPPAAPDAPAKPPKGK